MAVHGDRHGGLHHVLLQALSCDDCEQRPAGSDGQGCSAGSCAGLIVLLIILVIKQRQSHQQCTARWRQQLHPLPVGEAGRAGKRIKHIVVWHRRQRCMDGAARVAGGRAGGKPLAPCLMGLFVQVLEAESQLPTAGSAQSRQQVKLACRCRS